MLKLVIPILTLLLLNNNIIEWNKDRKLTWEDFKGATKDWNAAAVSYCGIDIQPVKTNIWTGKLTVKITAFFNTDSSFYFKERADSNVLRHEQFHFNIAELYARKMREELSKRKLVTTKIVKEVYERLYGEYSQFQDRYDRESRFGTYRSAQSRLENEILSGMDQLERFGQ